jgi:hypothetical protein
MSTDLAALRRTEELLARDEPVDLIVSELQTLFGLTYADAIAAVAATVLLGERGVSVPRERPAWSPELQMD